MSDQAACAMCADFWQHNHNNHQDIIDLRAELTALREAAQAVLVAWGNLDHESPGPCRPLEVCNDTPFHRSVQTLAASLTQPSAATKEGP